LQTLVSRELARRRDGLAALRAPGTQEAPERVAHLAGVRERAGAHEIAQRTFEVETEAPADLVGDGARRAGAVAALGEQTTYRLRQGKSQRPVRRTK